MVSWLSDSRAGISVILYASLSWWQDSCPGSGIVIVFKLKRKEEWYCSPAPCIIKAKSFPEDSHPDFLRIYYYLNVNHVTSGYKGVWGRERRLRMSFGQSADSDLVDMEISGQIYF